jgi:hypothetical protein
MLEEKSLSALVAQISAGMPTAESDLQQLVEKTSVDLFGSATRSLMDKLILASSIGALISTVGKVDEELALGPIKINVELVYVIPISLICVIAFYGLGFAILAQADVWRWRATYNQSVNLIRPFVERLQELLKHNAATYAEQAKLDQERITNGEDLGPDGEDGFLLKFKKDAKDASERSDEILKTILQITRRGVRAKQQAMFSVLVFMVLPMAFGATAIGLLTYFAVHVLPRP